MLEQKPALIDSFESAAPRTNAVHDRLDQLAEAYSGKSSVEAMRPTGPGACLIPLLAAMNWPGHSRHLVEALPHLQTIEDIETVRAVLVRLNYSTEPVSVSPGGLDALELPCLYSSDGKNLLVLIVRIDEGVEAFDCATGGRCILTSLAPGGTAYFLRPIDIAEERAELARRSWTGILLKRFRITIVQLLFVSFLINVLALLPSLFILAVYDTAIAAKSVPMLASLLAGIAIALAAEYGFRQIRGRALSYLGARWDVITGSKALERVLCLPVSLTQSGPISAQITRLRQFENLRDIFSGQMALALLDMPFILLYVAAIGLIGGSLIWAPVLLIAVYVLLGLISVPVMRRRYSMVGESRQKILRLIMETVTKHRALKECRAESIWHDRVSAAAAESAARHAHSEGLNLYVMTITQTLSSIAGLGTLFVGLKLVMTGYLSVGALIATMAIVWRFISPVQAAFLNLNRFQQVSNAFRQANQLMKLPPEREPGQLPVLFRKFRGHLTLNRLAFRYSPATDPALNGLSLRIPAGQLVAVTGPSGAGKSTLLRLIAKIHLPQGGSILIDEVDIRQIDAGELRHNLAYVPDYFDFFHGTISQNLRLAAPLATDADLRRACIEARLQDYASSLSAGLETWLKPDVAAKLPAGLRQRITLGRAWIKKVPIYLLDEPVNNLDRLGEEALLKKLEILRGNATVIMVTHRPSHMKIADRVIYMQDGQIMFDGKPEQVLPLIMKAA
ncbi:MAG TPA: ATP-binding cassette domain-containing protein [Aestuariivirgaceae bacterium]|nr:ATP-binding cassette domain-containing protein [Aestuariivirgaceae bacterium]